MNSLSHERAQNRPLNCPKFVLHTTPELYLELTFVGLKSDS